MKLTQKQSHTKRKLVYVIRFNGSKIPVNSPLAFTCCFWACLAPGRRVWWYHSVEMGVLTVAGDPADPALGSWASQPLLLPLCFLHATLVDAAVPRTPRLHPHLRLLSPFPLSLGEPWSSPQIFSRSFFSNICFSVRIAPDPFSTIQHLPTPAPVCLYLPSELFLQSTDLHQTLYSPYVPCLLPVSPPW